MPGRAPRNHRLSGQDGPWVLAMDLGGTKLAVGVFDASHRQVYHGRWRVGGASPSALQARVARILSRLAQAYQPVALGVASVGVTSPDGRVELAANLPAWEGVNVSQLLGSVGVPYVVQNDVKAAAWAEYRLGAGAGHDGVLYVNAGTGFAMALAWGGRVLAGAHGAAGEVAYWSWWGEEGIRQGRAPLEERVGGWGVARRAQAMGYAVDAKEVARSAEPALQRLWGEVVEDIGRAVALAATLVDPEVVVLGGGMARNGRLHAAVAKALQRWVPFPPTLRRARFGAQAALVGASVLAWEVAGKDPKEGSPGER